MTVRKEKHFSGGQMVRATEAQGSFVAQALTTK